MIWLVLWLMLGPGVRRVHGVCVLRQDGPQLVDRCYEWGRF